MSHITPFLIDALLFTHTGDDNDLHAEAANEWTNTADRTLVRITGETVDSCVCPTSERTIEFSVTKDGTFVGTFALYRIRPIAGDDNVVSALAAPMLGNLEDSIAREPLVLPDGSTTPVPDAEEDARRSYWQRTLAVMEWMLDNPLDQDDGTQLVLDEWLFPNVDDGDPPMCEWYGGRDHFDRWGRKVVEFTTGARGDEIPFRMTSTNKATDPDPTRPAVDF